MLDNKYRNCCETIKGKSKACCPYVTKNEYGTWTCGIDGVVQVEFYGCNPYEIRNFKKMKAEFLGEEIWKQ